MVIYCAGFPAIYGRQPLYFADHRRSNLFNGGFRLIFRVPEYSELSIDTGVRSRSDQEGWVYQARNIPVSEFGRSSKSGG